MEKADIPLLVEALRVPPIFKCYNGLICDGTEALCIVLKRFARISVPLLVYDFDVWTIGCRTLHDQQQSRGLDLQRLWAQS